MLTTAMVETRNKPIERTLIPDSIPDIVTTPGHTSPPIPKIYIIVSSYARSYRQDEAFGC